MSKGSTMSKQIPSNWIGDNYIRHSGFLPVADANDVIMLFPQVIDISNQVNLVTIRKIWIFLKDDEIDVRF